MSRTNSSIILILCFHRQKKTHTRWVRWDLLISVFKSKLSWLNGNQFDKSTMFSAGRISSGLSGDGISGF